MKNKGLHFVIIIFINLNINAQKLDPMLKVGIQSVEGASQTVNVITSFDERYEGIKGNQYLNDDWLYGDLFGDKGQILRKDVPVKFDAYNNEIIMKRPDGDTVAVYPASCIIRETLGNKMYFISKIPGLISKNKQNISQKYVFTLFDGNTKLIKYFRKEIELANYKGAYNDNRPYDHFKPISEYFLIDESGKIANVNLSKNQLLKLTKNHTQEVKTYIKTNLLDLSDENGMLSAINYYDSLKR
jgi:hypothetical protein